MCVCACARGSDACVCACARVRSFSTATYCALVQCSGLRPHMLQEGAGAKTFKDVCEVIHQSDDDDDDEPNQEVMPVCDGCPFAALVNVLAWGPRPQIELTLPEPDDKDDAEDAKPEEDQVEEPEAGTEEKKPRSKKAVTIY